MGTRALQVALDQRARAREQAEQGLAQAINAQRHAAEALSQARAQAERAMHARRAHHLPAGALAPSALERHAIERRGLLAAEASAQAAFTEAQRVLRAQTDAVQVATLGVEEASREEEVVARAIARAQVRDELERRRREEDADD